MKNLRHIDLIKKKAETIDNIELPDSFPIGFENIQYVEELSLDEKLDIFKETLEKISNPEIKNLAVMMIENAPQTFWYYPNQSEYGTTREHERGLGGLLLHTLRTLEYSDKLCDGWGVSDFERDIVLCATLVHDFFLDSFSVVNYNDINIHYHLIKPRLEFNSYRYNLENEFIFDLIMNAVEGHMGDECLLPNLYVKDNSFLKIVHLADRLANMEEVV